MSSPVKQLITQEVVVWKQNRNWCILEDNT